MSTRRSASLDGSLLARKGDAVPAVPESALHADAADGPRRGGPHFAGATAPPVEARPRDRGRGGRFVPLTKSRRGTVTLVAVALLAVVLMGGEQLLAPGDQAPAEDPVDAPLAGAPASDSGLPAEPDVVVEAPPPPAAEELPLPEPVLVRASAEAAMEPALPAPVEAPQDSDIVATVVPDAPIPPVAPVRKQSAAAKPVVTSGPYILQFAAFASASSAQNEAVRLQKALDAVLGERKVVVVEAVSAARKPIWRLRASGYPTYATARTACESIRKLKTGCLVIRR